MAMSLVKDSVEQITRLYYQASEMLLKELGCNMDNIHEFEIKQKIGFDQPREFWKNGRKAGESQRTLINFHAGGGIIS